VRPPGAGDTDRIDRLIQEQAKTLLPDLIVRVRDYRNDEFPVREGEVWRVVESAPFTVDVAIKTSPQHGIFDDAVKSVTSIPLQSMARKAFEVFSPQLEPEFMVATSQPLREYIEKIVAEYEEEHADVA
jgi:hypothetical protein